MGAPTSVQVRRPEGFIYDIAASASRRLASASSSPWPGGFRENRSDFSWRLVGGGLGLQLATALLLLKVPPARVILFGLNGVVTMLSDATRAGSGFVFGYIGGGPLPFTVSEPANLTAFAFSILPLVMVISALSAILWHWGILGLLVRLVASVLRRTLGVGGAVGLGAASMVFLGNIEGQLLVRPYLARMSRTELFTLMTVGLAVIAGTVFVLYASILKDVLPGALGHLLVASMMSLPASRHACPVIVPGAPIPIMKATTKAATVRLWKR